MIDGLILLVVAAAYFLGAYAVAFWVTCFAIVNGILAVARTLVNPNWYLRRRLEAGLEPVLDIKGLLIGKGVIILPLCALAWYFAGLAGYRAV